MQHWKTEEIKPAWYDFCQGVFIIQSNFCRVKDYDKLNTTIVNLQFFNSWYWKTSQFVSFPKFCLSVVLKFDQYNKNNIEQFE